MAHAHRDRAGAVPTRTFRQESCATQKKRWNGSYLAGSIRNAGLDPDNLPVNEAPGQYRNREDRPKTWKEIWGAGQGVGNIDDIPTVAELVDRLELEYCAARRRIADSVNALDTDPK